MSHLRANKHHSSKLQHSWNKHGEEKFAFLVLEYAENSALAKVEQFWIDKLKAHSNGYNILPIARSSLGAKLSASTREKIKKARLKQVFSKATLEKMSASHKGTKLPESQKQKIRESLLGRKRTPFTEEHRARIGMKSKGRSKSPETIEKLRNASTGRKHTQEAKAKMSLSGMGKIISQEQREKISLSLTGRPGRPHTKESKAKISASRKALAQKVHVVAQ